jgi:hypothetical protein
MLLQKMLKKPDNAWPLRVPEGYVEDLDLNIDIDYESCELFIYFKGFSNGLAILVDTFGIWCIREAISEKNDGFLIPPIYAYFLFTVQFEFILWSSHKEAE